MSAFRYDKADAQPIEPDNIMINISDIHQQNNYSTTNINRRVSATRLVKDADGTLKIERKNTDLGIAIQRRISAGSLPSIIPIKPLPIVEPLLGMCIYTYCLISYICLYIWLAFVLVWVERYMHLYIHNMNIHIHA